MMFAIKSNPQDEMSNRASLHSIPANAYALILFLFYVVNMHAAENIAESKWMQLPLLPDKLGLAGAYAGVSDGRLLVAGGANFPEKMPWEGGKKVWHDTVYTLDRLNGQWKTAAKLPRPLGYGVSVSHHDSVICVGGSDSTRHYADAFRLRLRDGKCAVEPLPALPIPLALMSGALVSNVLYIAGGCETPGETRAENRLFAMDFNVPEPTWRSLDPIPGEARFLACAAGYNGAFYLFGGAALKKNSEGKAARRYLQEALCYRQDEGWTRLANLPKPCVAAPSPAPMVNSRILLLGGDDGSLIDFQPLDKHPGFPKMIMAYDPAQNQWSRAGEVPAPRATTPCTEWRGMIIVPSGEVRPGVRSPEIWSLQPR